MAMWSFSCVAIYSTKERKEKNERRGQRKEEKRKEKGTRTRKKIARKKMKA